MNYLSVKGWFPCYKLCQTDRSRNTKVLRVAKGEDDHITRRLEEEGTNQI